jgi:hypothetical protein
MKKQLTKPALIVITLLFITGNITMIGFAQNVPPEIAAALIIKLSALEKNLSSGSEITIYVMGDEQIAASLKKGLNSKIGKATLTNVSSGESLPSDKPSILYIGNEAQLIEATQYTQANNVLSIGSSEAATKGATLGIGLGDDGKPTVHLNLSSSKEEGLDWNPAIMKIAKTIK